MNAPQVHKRDVTTVTLSANGVTDPIDLPRVADILGLGFRLRGAATVSAGSPTLPAHSPAELISRIDVYANGKDTLLRAPFRMLAFGNYGQRCYEDADPPATSSTSNFSVTGFVDFAHLRGAREKDTALQSYLTNQLQCVLSFGAIGDILTGGTTSLGATYVDIFTLELKERAENVGEDKLVKKTTWQRATWTAANTNLEIRLPRGNTTSLITVLATDDGEPSNALINSIEHALNKTDVRQRLRGDNIRAENARVLERDAPTGFYFIDPLYSRSLKTVVDTRGAGITENELVLDVAAPAGTTGAADVLIEEVIGL